MALIRPRTSFIGFVISLTLACSDAPVAAPVAPASAGPNAARAAAGDYRVVIMDPALHTALAINNRGQATGDGATGFVWTERAGLHSLGTPYDGSNGQDINEPGTIVGSVSTFGTPPTGAGRNSAAAIWTEADGWRVIGSLAPGAASQALAVNNRGMIVGTATEVGGPFLWTEGDGMVALGTLPGRTSGSATDINERGDIVGTAGGGGSDFTLRAFLWTSGDGMRELPAEGWARSSANGINNRGWVVGSVAGPNGVSQAALWTPDGGLELLGTLGGPSSVAYGVNDRGEVVGFALRAPATIVPYLWTRGSGMVALPVPTDGRPGIAFDINARGDIVGTAFLGSSQQATAVAWLRR